MSVAQLVKTFLLSEGTQNTFIFFLTGCRGDVEYFEAFWLFTFTCFFRGAKPAIPEGQFLSIVFNYQLLTLYILRPCPSSQAWKSPEMTRNLLDIYPSAVIQV